MIDICPHCQIATPCDCEDEQHDKYTNYYHCDHCGTEWHDVWSCMCNDRCPKCNKEIEPYDSQPNYGE